MYIRIAIYYIYINKYIANRATDSVQIYKKMQHVHTGF